MKILLVRPRRRKQAITLGEFMFSEPIGLECVYAVLKDKYQIRILDLMAGDEDFCAELREWQPDVVGFTSLCIDVFGVRELAKEAKTVNPNLITVVGGTQSFFSPENFYCDEIDHVMRYTTVENLHTLFGYLERGEEVPLIDGVHSKVNGYVSTEKDRINDYIVPDRSATEKYRDQYSYFGYRPAAILQTSRGCSSVCKFCMRWKIEGTHEKDEPLESIIQQIEEIKEPSIMIFDNNFLHNQERLERFCDLLEERGIKKNFICYGSVWSIVKHAETMKRLAKNGLCAVLVGYESFKQDELDAYNKRVTLEDNLAASKILRECGIDCWASFIVHPEWDVQDFKGFRRYLRQLMPEVSTPVPLTPFPKTYLFEKYKDRLLFDPKDFDQWSFSLVAVQPEKISLRRYYFEVLKTNLFINLMLNNPTYMVKKFGFGTVFRIAVGSMGFVKRYVRLMVKG